MYMIMFVLDDPNRLDDLLAAWGEAGVSGVTIIESTGIARRQKKRIPMRYLFEAPGGVDEGHYTLFAIVPDETVVKDILRASEALIGDLDEPNTGIFSAWPLEYVKGYPPPQKGTA